MTRFLRTPLFIGAIALSSLAQAALVVSTPAAGNVVDFSQFGAQITIGASTIEVGALVGESISLTASGDNRVGPMGHGLGDNGVWFRSGVLNNATPDGYFTFTFNAGGVSSIGGFMNYATPELAYAPQMLIEALDSLGNVLESYDLFTAAPISTPNGNDDGEFRGISRGANDIFGFRVVGNFAVIDDLRFDRSNVPEPTTLALIGLALAGLCFSRRRA